MMEIKEKNLLEPKEGYIERFWNVTLPRYRRKKRMRAISLSIAGLLILFSFLSFFKFSSSKENHFQDNVWKEAFALIENEPNNYDYSIVWVSKEDVEFYNNLSNEKNFREDIK